MYSLDTTIKRSANQAKLMHAGEAEDDHLAVLQWKGLSEDLLNARSAILSLLSESLGKPGEGTAVGVHKLHSKLSYPRPQNKEDEGLFFRRVAQHKWAELAFVCVDLMVLPDDVFQRLSEMTSILKKVIVRKRMAEILLNWVRGTGVYEVQASRYLTSVVILAHRGRL